MKFQCAFSDFMNSAEETTPNLLSGANRQVQLNYFGQVVDFNEFILFSKGGAIILEFSECGVPSYLS